jgi:hypothetical protein
MFAEAIGNTEFFASNGWLGKFTKRNNIVFNILSGEAADVSTETVTDWKKRLNNLCKDYSAEDIFNCDETGLFWRAIPSKSLTFKGEKCSKGKQSKERITLLLCVNRTGSEKKNLLVIGKSAKPRCFKTTSSAM